MEQVFQMNWLKQTRVPCASFLFIINCQTFFISFFVLLSYFVKHLLLWECLFINTGILLLCKKPDMISFFVLFVFCSVINGGRGWEFWELLRGQNQVTMPNNTYLRI